MSVSRIPLQKVFRSRTFSQPQRDGNAPTSPTSTPVSAPVADGPNQSRRLSHLNSVIMTTQRGTRTPIMLEYERQAEVRAMEQDKMQAERDRMLQEEADMRKDQEKIAQEEYEMQQYYQAEALKHAEELRLYQEEVRIHQKRKIEHQRKVKDHEATSEAFAQVILMSAKVARDRQVGFMGASGMGIGNGNQNGNLNGIMNGSK